MKGWGGNVQKVCPTSHPDNLNSPTQSTRIHQAQQNTKKKCVYPVCCIYHAPHPVGESSSSSSSSSDSSSDDDASDGDDDGRARISAKGKGKRKQHRHGEGGCGHDCSGEGEEGKVGRGKRKGRNAYERVPKKKGGVMKT